MQNSYAKSVTLHVLIMVLVSHLSHLAQWLPVDPRVESADPLASTYAGEVCAWYDVHRLLWRPQACKGRVEECENDPRSYPRLGELSLRPTELPTATVCDGYGVQGRRVRRPCQRCDGDNFERVADWQVLQCAAVPLAPPPPPPGARAPELEVLLVASDHNNHGLFGQLERVLNQLHLAESRGVAPFVFLGRKVMASPSSCNVGENQYYDPSAGDNVWEYYFEQVSSYRLGAPTLGGKPVRLLIAAAEDARRHAIHRSVDAVTSYFEFQRYDETLHAIRQRVRRVGATLVRRWVRVRAPLRHAVRALLLPWRRRSRHLLGVHLRGTDKVTHPRIPLDVFFPKVDAYLAAHADALVLLCTDDAADYTTFAARYGGRLVSRGTGYDTRNVVRDPKLPRKQVRHAGSLSHGTIAPSLSLSLSLSRERWSRTRHTPHAASHRHTAPREGHATPRHATPRLPGPPVPPAPATLGRCRRATRRCSTRCCSRTRTSCSRAPRRSPSLRCGTRRTSSRPTSTFS